MANEGHYLTAEDIRSRINGDGTARAALESLKIHPGYSEDVLLAILVNIANYSPAWDAFEVHTVDHSGQGLDRRQVRAAAKKIREAAALIKRTKWLLYTKNLSQSREAEIHKLPQEVSEFASALLKRLDDKDLSPRSPTIWDSALVLLMVYLKKVTGEYRDSAVCELLRTAAGFTKNETALNQWRYRNREEIESKLSFLI